MEDTFINKRKHEEGDSTSEDSSHHKTSRKSKKSKSRKKDRRKRGAGKHRHDDDSNDSGSSSSDDSRKHRKEKKRKKHKKHKKRSKQRGNDNDDSGLQFGKYGILKRDDFSRMQRALEVWLDEVKSISASVLSRRDLQTYFEEFREDFNTATLPHKKYYNFDAWEQAEWDKKKSESTPKQKSNDELAHKALRRQEEANVKLDTETIADMKHQAALRTQMQVAFRTGDTETYERLRRRLNADRDANVQN